MMQFIEIYSKGWQKPDFFLHVVDIDGLVQDCSNFSANALELQQSCTKPSIITHVDDLTTKGAKA